MAAMTIRFWGVRGSIAAPGPATARYGGNTTCIEVRTHDGEIIILDAGTGLFPLSQSLMASQPVRAHLFLTHTHWDHIQGLPFFIPNFMPGNLLRLYGARDNHTGAGVERALQVQLQHSYFPLRTEDLKGSIEYINLEPGQPAKVGSATVTPVVMEHPTITFGYRIECGGKSVFFTGDHEPPLPPDLPQPAAAAAIEQLSEAEQNAIARAIEGVDVLIADTTYTAAEYPDKIGWGHGHFGSSIAYALRAGVKTLYCTHHEPTRSDDALEAVFAEALRLHPVPPKGPQVLLAREGLVHEL